MNLRETSLKILRNIVKLSLAFTLLFIIPAPSSSFLTRQCLEAAGNCGTGACTLRQDRRGGAYCTCEGLRGRARMSCCR